MFYKNIKNSDGINSMQSKRIYIYLKSDNEVALFESSISANRKAKSHYESALIFKVE